MVVEKGLLAKKRREELERRRLDNALFNLRVFMQDGGGENKDLLTWQSLSHDLSSGCYLGRF